LEALVKVSSIAAKTMAALLDDSSISPELLKLAVAVASSRVTPPPGLYYPGIAGACSTRGEALATSLEGNHAAAVAFMLSFAAPFSVSSGLVGDMQEAVLLLLSRLVQCAGAWVLENRSAGVYRDASASIDVLGAHNTPALACALAAILQSSSSFRDARLLCS